MPLPTDNSVGGIVFRGSVRESALLARYLNKQTSVDDIVGATDELICEGRGRGQGHSKVKHLSELLR